MLQDVAAWDRSIVRQAEREGRTLIGAVNHVAAGQLVRIVQYMVQFSDDKITSESIHCVCTKVVCTRDRICRPVRMREILHYIQRNRVQPATGNDVVRKR